MSQRRNSQLQSNPIRNENVTVRKAETSIHVSFISMLHEIDSSRFEGRIVNNPDALIDIRLPIVKQSCELQLFDYAESEKGELLLRFPIKPI